MPAKKSRGLACEETDLVDSLFMSNTTLAPRTSRRSTLETSNTLCATPCALLPKPDAANSTMLETTVKPQAYLIFALGLEVIKLCPAANPWRYI